MAKDMTLSLNPVGPSISSPLLPNSYSTCLDSGRPRVWILVQPSVCSRYVIRLISWVDIVRLPVSSLGSKSRILGALCNLLLTPIQEGRWAGWAWQGDWSPACSLCCLIWWGHGRL